MTAHCAILTVDWQDALFAHFALAQRELRGLVEEPADRFDGAAWLSLICLTA